MTDEETCAHFEHLLNLDSDILHVVWDLDGTLGRLPGWEGEALDEYVERLPLLQKLLAIVRLRRGGANILCSRNALFCDDHYSWSGQDFRGLGMDAVLKCYRFNRGSKVHEMQPFGGRRFLIDDQAAECERAAQEGAWAMQVHAPIMQALATGAYTIHAPKDYQAPLEPVWW